MKYFTPELYNRFQSDDEEIYNKAVEEWETTLVKYQEHLESIKHVLRQSGAADASFHATFRLHDSQLKFIVNSNNLINLVIQLEGTGYPYKAGQYLELSYFVVDYNHKDVDLATFSGEITITEVPEMVEGLTTPNFILYDEFDVDEQGFLIHNILTNGREIKIRCTDMAISGPYDVIEIMKPSSTKIEI